MKLVIHGHDESSDRFSSAGVAGMSTEMLNDWRIVHNHSLSSRDALSARSQIGGTFN